MEFQSAFLEENEIGLEDKRKKILKTGRKRRPSQSYGNDGFLFVYSNHNKGADKLKRRTYWRYEKKGRKS